MKLSTIALCLLALLLQHCASMIVTAPKTDNLPYENLDVSRNIGIARLYPTGQTFADPVVGVGEGITLEFDLLEEEYAFLSAKIIHCNFDWKKSQLTDLEYLTVVNEFQLSDFSYSINTRVPYISYKLNIPGLLASGNYVVVVYRDDDPSQLILTRRLVVYRNDVNMSMNIVYSNIAAQRRSHHQITLEVDHPNLQIFNPQEQLKLTLLQNHRWNTAISTLKPSLVRSDQNYLEYRLYNGENEFPGGNEFRLADVRSTQFRGLNVERIFPGENYINITLNQDKPRSATAYTNLFQDNEGAFVIANTNPGQSPDQTDYVMVEFSLDSPPNYQSVFITGKFNNWTPSARDYMTYNTNTGRYEGSRLLKQGQYNYQYTTESLKNPIEGDFVETGNDYEAILYFRNPTTNTDEVIGYAKSSSRN